MMTSKPGHGVANHNSSSYFALSIVPLLMLGTAFLSGCSDEAANVDDAVKIHPLSTASTDSKSGLSVNAGDTRFAIWQAVDAQERSTTGAENTLHDAISGAHVDHVHSIEQRRNRVMVGLGNANGWISTTSLQTGEWQDSQRVRRDATNNTLLGIDAVYDRDYAIQTAIASDGTGKATALWTQKNVNGIVDLYRCAYGTSGWCVTPAILDTATSVSIKDPQIALNSSGDGLAVWLQKDGNVWAVYGADYVSGVWRAPARISDVDANNNAIESGDVRVSLSDNGAGFAVWKQAIDNAGISADMVQYAIQARRYAASAWAGSTLQVSDGLGSAAKPDISMIFDATDDRAIIVWQQSDATNSTDFGPIPNLDVLARTSIWARAYDSGAPVAAATAIQTDDLSTVVNEDLQKAFDVRVAIDANGNATAVWVQEEIVAVGDNKWNNTSATRIWANRYSAGSTSWGSATMLEGGTRLDAIDPQVVNVAGKAVVAWRQWNEPVDASAYNVYARTYNANWSAKMLIAASTFSDKDFISLAASSTTATVSYTAANGGIETATITP